VLRLLTPAEGLAGVAKGIDVYLFLTGMMLLAETAREEKLFDWLAAHATQLSKGSAQRLFLLIYLVGVVVTTFLSNDATAVVLTPAVASAVRAAKVKNPLPYLFICAFIANAASFVLPISNPANLVIYGAHMPPLLVWLPRYLLPAAVSIVATYFLLLRTQKAALGQEIAQDIDLPTLERGGQVALAGIGVTAVALLVASGFDWSLGLPTAITGTLTAIVVLITARKSPVEIVKNVSWSVLPLVAGLFILVEALNKTGVTRWLTTLLNASAEQSAAKTAWASGVGVALLCNVMNNLPAGLITGNVLQTAHVSETIKSAMLIGIDLGPNLSVTGSLATILWLVALRRENIEVSAGQFLKLGALVMTVPLLLAVGSLFLLPR
jgi:arsenical pump membrane protein